MVVCLKICSVLGSKRRCLSTVPPYQLPRKKYKETTISSPGIIHRKCFLCTQPKSTERETHTRPLESSFSGTVMAYRKKSRIIMHRIRSYLQMVEERERTSTAYYSSTLTLHINPQFSHQLPPCSPPTLVFNNNSTRVPPLDSMQESLDGTCNQRNQPQPDDMTSEGGCHC